MKSLATFPLHKQARSRLARPFWPMLLIVAGGMCDFYRLDARVLAVGQDASQLTLQVAIATAQPGDTVQVFPGAYKGSIVLDRSLNLEGIGKPVLRGNGRGSVLTVLADQCTIRGFIVEYSGKDLQGEDSGILLKSNRNVVAHNELRDVLYGIYLYHSQGNSLRSNVIHGRKELQVGERGAGLHLWNSVENVIEDNVIEHARDGMYIQSSPRNTIRRNRVFHLRYGLHFMSSDDNHFEENLFSNNVAGAAIMYSKGIEFRRNAFVHNRGVSSFGILFQDCDQCLSEGNLIANNATGLFAEALRNSVFRNNVVAENDVALQIYGSSSNLSFSGNHFVENLSPLQIVGKRANARWEIDGRGNIWSDYDGYDLDGDNVGDLPHRIQNVFEYLEGNHPRLRIYLNSPAAQALAAAERAFPVIQQSSEIDSRPIMRAGYLPIEVALLARKPSSHVGLAVVSIVMLFAGALMLWQGKTRAVKALTLRTKSAPLTPTGEAGGEGDYNAVNALGLCSGSGKPSRPLVANRCSVPQPHRSTLTGAREAGVGSLLARGSSHYD